MRAVPAECALIDRPRSEVQVESPPISCRSTTTCGNHSRIARAAAALRLRLREPVAVHVEEVVIRSAARPWLVVLGCRRVRIAAGAGAEQILEDEARPPVGVLHRIDDDDRVPQDGLDVCVVARGKQVIGLGEGGVG